MPPALLVQEGWRDLRERVWMACLWALRFRIRRQRFHAEVELGFLGWEQVDLYDQEVVAAAAIIREFEEAQAALQNTSAELSKRNATLDEELAHEKALHEETQASLAAERAPIAARLEEAETTHRRKLEAIQRFDRALDEIARVEKELEAQSVAFMNTAQPSLAIRREAREISDHLTSLSVERSLVVADRQRAAAEGAPLDSIVADLRADLRRIDAASSAARNRLADATRRIAGEKRRLERERRKSTLRMSHLDRKKRRPYRTIGACLAETGIAPLNQPAVLEKVIALGRRDLALTEALSELHFARAAADARILIAFYLLLAALLAALVFILKHA
jgi:hypothetical protein